MPCNTTVKSQIRPETPYLRQTEARQEISVLLQISRSKPHGLPDVRHDRHLLAGLQALRHGRQGVVGLSQDALNTKYI